MCANSNPSTLSDESFTESEINRKLIQVLRPIPVLKMQYAVAILSALSQKLLTKADVKRIVKRLNHQLNCCQIKRVTCDITGVKYLVLINTYRYFLTRSISRYSVIEMKMFKLIMGTLICSNPIGQITVIDLFNLSSKITPSISTSETKKIVKKFVREWWLHDQGGIVYFGVRSTAEITPFLLENYRDSVRVCSRCKFVALTAVSCKNEDCSAVVHYQCLKKLKKLSPTSYCCLSCGQKLSFD